MPNYTYASLAKLRTWKQVVSARSLPWPGRYKPLYGKSPVFTRQPSGVTKKATYLSGDRLPVWRTDLPGITWMYVDRLGTYTGLVHNAGTPLSNIRIRMYYTPTGQLIRSTKSAPDGTFSISGLDRSSDDYYIIALPNRANPEFNGKIANRVTPV